MKCPNCKLINPETALRCDCGYDFQSGKMKAPYFVDVAAMPAWVGILLLMQTGSGFFYLLLLFIFTRMFETFLISSLIWFFFVILAIVRMTKGEDGARIALAFLAFPIGLTFLLSSDLKSYVRQRSKSD